MDINNNFIIEGNATASNFVSINPATQPNQVVTLSQISDVYTYILQNGMIPNSASFYQSSTTLTTANQGQIVYYNGNGNATFSLPLSNSLNPFDFKLVICNLSHTGTLTIVTQGYDNLEIPRNVLTNYEQYVCLVNEPGGWNTLWFSQGVNPTFNSLSVTGNTSLNGLSVNNNASFNNSISVNGNLSLNGNLNISNLLVSHVLQAASNGLVTNGPVATQTPTPNSIPISESNGVLNSGWLGLPPNGLIYYTSTEVYMGTVGGFTTFTFDFSNWNQDYQAHTNSSANFYVVPIIQYQYFETGQTGDYNIRLMASTKPTYLNGNNYQMQLTLGHSDAAYQALSVVGTNEPPILHAYSTVGAVGYLIHFIGGPENILWNLLPYANNNPGLQMQLFYLTQGTYYSYGMSIYNSDPVNTYQVTSATYNGSTMAFYEGSEILTAGGTGYYPTQTIPPFCMGGGMLNLGTSSYSPITIASTDTIIINYKNVSTGATYSQTLSGSSLVTLNLNNIMRFTTNP